MTALTTPALSLLSRLPVRRRVQAVVAEVLAQAIAAGMDRVEACDVASRTVRGWRVRRVLAEATRHVRAGYPLAQSIETAGMPLNPDLRAAMEVGEERGRLDAELAAGARRLDPTIERRVAAAIGRRESVRQFARSLARLLAEHPLTVGLVSDAARLVGAPDRGFRRAVPRLLDDFEGGYPLSDALARHPAVFDALFVECVARADTRESMRRVLARLGGDHRRSDP